MGSSIERRRAHRRVGAAAIAVFLAILLVGALRHVAQADPSGPAVAPAGTVQPTQPSEPAYPGPYLHRDHRFGGGGDDPGFGGGGGQPGFGGGADPGAGGSAPAAPSTSGGGSQT
jgi:hypothetical protein